MTWIPISQQLPPDGEVVIKEVEEHGRVFNVTTNSKLFTKNNNMGKGIIVKLIDENTNIAYYFEWSTVVDAPITQGMELEDFKKYYQEEYGKYGFQELLKRLEQVEDTGCSSYVDTLKGLLSINRAGEYETALTAQEIIEKFALKKTKQQIAQQLYNEISKRFEEIEKFNKIIGFLSKPVDPSLEWRMLVEEAEEYRTACREQDEAKIKDALADLMVVLWGTILKHGFKDKFWADILRAVNESNFTKFCTTEQEAVQSCEHYRKRGVQAHYEYNSEFNVYVIKRADGKGLKSINFKEPKL